MNIDSLGSSSNHVALSASHGAMLARPVSFGEKMHARGVYHAQMSGPLEQYRAEYIELRDQIAKHEASDLISRIIMRPVIDKMREELLSIPSELKWDALAPNLVTTVGGNGFLDTYLSGVGYTAAWYIGLISSTSYTTGPALADTMSSHGGWAEDTTYSNAARGTTAWSSAASKSKSLSAGIDFFMNGSTTIKGCFLANNNTKGGNTGLLFSAGLFDGGDQPVVNGNTLTVTYTASV